MVLLPSLRYIYKAVYRSTRTLGCVLQLTHWPNDTVCIPKLAVALCL